MNMKMNLTQLAKDISAEDLPAAFVRQALRKFIKAEAESRLQHGKMFAEPLLCLDREVNKHIKKMKQPTKMKGKI